MNDDVILLTDRQFGEAFGFHQEKIICWADLVKENVFENQSHVYLKIEGKKVLTNQKTKFVNSVFEDLSHKFVTNRADLFLAKDDKRKLNNITPKKEHNDPFYFNAADIVYSMLEVAPEVIAEEKKSLADSIKQYKAHLEKSGDLDAPFGYTSQDIEDAIHDQFIQTIGVLQIAPSYNEDYLTRISGFGRKNSVVKEGEKNPINYDFTKLMS